MSLKDRRLFLFSCRTHIKSGDRQPFDQREREFPLVFEDVLARGRSVQNDYQIEFVCVAAENELDLLNKREKEETFDWRRVCCFPPPDHELRIEFRRLLRPKFRKCARVSR